MKIVIAGAGDIGFHLASLLSFEDQDIALIDMDQEVLDYSNGHLDVLTVRGDCTKIKILERAGVREAELFIAVTTSEKTNLITAILAKKMGAKQTIARVRNEEYLAQNVRSTFQDLGIDSLISPSQIAAREIQRLVERVSLTDIFEFEGGKIDVLGATLRDDSVFVNKTIAEIDALKPEISFKPIAILRGHRTLVPKPNTVLLRNDHIYFITAKECIDDLVDLLSERKEEVKNVMIIGDTVLAMETAKLLEDKYQVVLVNPNKESSKEMAEDLSDTLVIHGNPSQVELLREEGLGRMDAFIALTKNSEINIVTSLTAKNNGVRKTIAQVENVEYTHISQDIGVDTLINKKIIAANNIFRYVRKGQIEAITSLHGVNAEIIEFVINKNNQLTRKPLKKLHFPEESLIGGVIRGQEPLIPDENFQLQLNDKVIVFAMPEAIARVEKLFR